MALRGSLNYENATRFQWWVRFPFPPSVLFHIRWPMQSDAATYISLISGKLGVLLILLITILCLVLIFFTKIIYVYLICN